MMMMEGFVVPKLLPWTSYFMRGRVIGLIAAQILSIITIASYTPSHLPKSAWRAQRPTFEETDIEVSDRTASEILR